MDCAAEEFFDGNGLITDGSGDLAEEVGLHRAFDGVTAETHLGACSDERGLIDPVIGNITEGLQAV
ncbi:hypothetical protein GCM10023224_16190 [Streptomonospora halophila]|uniref:Uncharacterized protein n=1 Tax=Streptomonospora halophila TaxID=427369 RepID=A0ABP9GBG0_9ACTN